MNQDKTYHELLECLFSAHEQMLKRQVLHLGTGATPPLACGPLRSQHAVVSSRRRPARGGPRPTRPSNQLGCTQIFLFASSGTQTFKDLGSCCHGSERSAHCNSCKKASPGQQPDSVSQTHTLAAAETNLAARPRANPRALSTTSALDRSQ